MISLKLPAKPSRTHYHSTSYTWNKQQLLFTWNTNPYYYSGPITTNIVQADTRNVLHTKINGQVLLGHINGYPQARLRSLVPQCRNIPDDPITLELTLWPKSTPYCHPQKFKTNRWKYTHTHGHTLAGNNKLQTKQDLLPDYLQDTLSKLKKDEIVIHNFKNTNTKVFQLDGIPILTTVNPTQTLVASVTKISIFFFDID